MKVEKGRCFWKLYCSARGGNRALRLKGTGETVPGERDLMWKGRGLSLMQRRVDLRKGNQEEKQNRKGTKAVHNTKFKSNLVEGGSHRKATRSMEGKGPGSYQGNA